MYESFRLSYVTVSLVYKIMQKWIDQPNVNAQSNMVMLKDSTFVIKKCVGKIKEYTEFIVKSTENMKKTPEDGSVPRGFYTLTTSTPNKKHHVRIPDRKRPSLIKVQGAKDTISSGRTYLIEKSGFYDRDDRGEWIMGLHYQDPVMAGRADAEYDRIINGNDSDLDSDDEWSRKMYKSHMYYKEFLDDKQTQTDPVICVESRIDNSNDSSDFGDDGLSYNQTSCFSC